MTPNKTYETSGGAFNYQLVRLEEWKQTIQQAIADSVSVSKDLEVHKSWSDETMNKLRDLVSDMEKIKARLQQADYFLSGDISEEQFNAE